MTDVKEHPPGTFCWVDLATTDQEGAKQFYTGLFGWQAIDTPAGETMTYTMLQKDGKHVCGLYRMSDEMRGQGIPPHWQSYVRVADSDASAEKAQQLGAAVLMPPADVFDAGRMALIQDPTGAPLALWQAKQHTGAELIYEPNTMCWNELYTADVEAAAAFYAGLFGWTTKTMTGATGQPYIEFKSGDCSIGGMMAIQKEWGEVPPHWAVYFTVENCDAALEKAKSLGGTVEMEPLEIEKVGRFAIVKDPHGGHFAVIQMKAGLV